MKARLTLRRSQLLLGLAALLLFGGIMAPAPASAQYYGSQYGYGYGSYYGSGYSPYSSYYGSSYSPYSSYYGSSSYSPYSYYGNSYSPYSNYSGYNPYSSYYGYNPYSSYYGYNPYSSYSGYNPYSSYYGYNPYSAYSNPYASYYGYPYYNYNTPIGTTTALAAPTGLTVTGNTGNIVTLTWTASVGASSYQVLQSSNSGTYLTVATTPATQTTATVGNLINGQIYSFQVVALDAYGNRSTASVAVSVTAGATAFTLTATRSVDRLSANLTWTAVAGATGYTVFQATGVAPNTVGAYAPVATVGAGITSAAPGGLAAGTSYTFIVQALGPGTFSQPAPAP